MDSFLIVVVTLAALLVGAVALLYLVYLRRQTRIEERVRRRRAQRLARSRLGVENTDDREFDDLGGRCAIALHVDDPDAFLV